LDTAAILDLLKRAVDQRQVKISLHAAEEALAEEITRREMEAAMLSAELLEDYPDWWLGPSCLVHGQTISGTRSSHRGIVFRPARHDHHGIRATSSKMDNAHPTRR
jgi:hypothetical protein